MMGREAWVQQATVGTEARPNAEGVYKMDDYKSCTRRCTTSSIRRLRKQGIETRNGQWETSRRLLCA